MPCVAVGSGTTEPRPLDSTGARGSPAQSTTIPRSPGCAWSWTATLTIPSLCSPSASSARTGCRAYATSSPPWPPRPRPHPRSPEARPPSRRRRRRARRRRRLHRPPGTPSRASPRRRARAPRAPPEARSSPCPRRRASGVRYGKPWTERPLPARCPSRGPRTPSGSVVSGRTQASGGSGTTGQTYPHWTGQTGSLPRSAISGRSPGCAWSRTLESTTRTHHTSLVSYARSPPWLCGRCLT
mmetsp:Transcript_100097/g.278892  ORF Transcript_100097/g.278892 Transcript_100097/m.278892 type:complete len:241 (+) Transcript_100097:2418-3140(+)